MPRPMISMKPNADTARPRIPRWAWLVAVVVILTVLVAGCTGGGPYTSRKATALSTADVQSLGEAQAEIEQSLPPLPSAANAAGSATAGAMTPALLAPAREKLHAQYNTFDQVYGNVANDPNTRARARFLEAYITEYLATVQPDPMANMSYLRARDMYLDVIKLQSGYAMQAQYRVGVLAANYKLDGDAQKLSIEVLNALRMAAMQAKQTKGSPEPLVQVRVNPAAPMPADGYPFRQPTPVEIAGMSTAAGAENRVPLPGTAAAPNAPVFRQVDVYEYTLQRLDYYHAHAGGFPQLMYLIISGFVQFFLRLSPLAGIPLALFFLALMVKLITTPFTVATYRGMRDMQRVQPLIKELQEKYKDDRAKLAEEQMRLMKEHKVNPTGGCLPMLIQIPFFIVVYQGISYYTLHFYKVPFLWVPSLADPNLPLLILYALSMILTQRLTATPTADPQQKAMQTQMTYLMPILFVIMLQTIASAFVLYWFFLNVLSSAHQYYLLRSFNREDAMRTPLADTPVDETFLSELPARDRPAVSSLEPPAYDAAIREKSGQTPNAPIEDDAVRTSLLKLNDAGLQRLRDAAELTQQANEAAPSNKKKAAMLYKKALEKNPYAVQAALGYSGVMEAMGNLQDAVNQLEQTLKLDPKNKQLRGTLESLKARLAGPGDQKK